MTTPIEQKILDELLTGEFKDLGKRKKIELKWKDYGKEVFRLCAIHGGNYYTLLEHLCNPAMAWVMRDKKKNIFPIIYFNLNFKKELRKYKELLENLLRHELLHIELNKHDDDKEFQREIIKRRIDRIPIGDWFFSWMKGRQKK